ncbi:hypothetical protein [Micromonospora sp. URMC 103]
MSGAIQKIQTRRRTRCAPWIYAPYNNQSFTEYDRSFTGIGVVH